MTVEEEEEGGDDPWSGARRAWTRRNLTSIPPIAREGRREGGQEGRGQILR